MPNPKLGTVTFEVGKAVRDLKAGKSEFKAEKAGIVQLSVARVSFDAAKIEQNLRALLDALLRARPAGAKGNYIRTISVSTTMGPGIKINPAEIEQSAEAA